MAISTTPKHSTSFSNEFSLQRATSSLQSQYKTDVTFSLHELDKFSFFLKLTKYVLHLNFSIDFALPYMVFTSFVLLKWSLTVLVLNRLLPLLFHTFKSLLGWNVFVILLNRQSLPFLYIHGKYQTPVFTFRHFWFKDPLMLEFIFLWYLY